jgi:hypothetical protein
MFFVLNKEEITSSTRSLEAQEKKKCEKKIMYYARRNVGNFSPFNSAICARRRQVGVWRRCVTLGLCIEFSVHNKGDEI